MTSQGTLRCQCFKGNSIEPLGNAKITLTDEKNTITKVFNTNNSGYTDGVILDTPDLSASQKPGEIPYGLFNIIVERAGFQPLKVNGVQVYPDRIAIQNCNLTEQSARDATRLDVIDIKPNRLVGGDFPDKIPEAEIKPMPKPSGTVILPAVVVPQFIIVHAGVPDDTTAPDYTVAYTDYIKNVASSEIFSTWPESTIRANVYCIVSFTLNRIYTEWYRGKGKRFDITNNTAFDQAFVYGRTIYNTISNVVDELFSSYLKRSNEKQPLLTQYCNGTTSTCPGWLTQWGSKYLGDKGDTPYEILTHFYGYDLNIATAPKVQGTPTSYPGYTLQLNYSGIYVRRLQTYLNSISNSYPLINKVAVDGNYGPSTQAAVKTYQQIFNLPVTGNVDYATWYSISNTYVAVNKIAELRGYDEDEFGGIFVPPSMYDIPGNVPKIKY